MSYGTPEWESWILGEDESLKMIKAAYVCRFTYFWDVFSPFSTHSYDAGINTFDTANVCFVLSNLLYDNALTACLLKAYSNGVSEVVLGKAIQEFNLPRDEIVVMTKVITRRSSEID